MTRRSQTSSQPVTHIVAVPDPDFEPGDPVRVKGRRGSFRFVARCRNTHTSAEWRDVRGGTAGHERLRSFEPEQVLKVPKKSRRNGNI